MNYIVKTKLFEFEGRKIESSSFDKVKFEVSGEEQTTIEVAREDIIDANPILISGLGYFEVAVDFKYKWRWIKEKTDLRILNHKPLVISCNPQADLSNYPRGVEQKATRNFEELLDMVRQAEQEKYAPIVVYVDGSLSEYAMAVRQIQQGAFVPVYFYFKEM